MISLRSLALSFSSLGKFWQPSFNRYTVVISFLAIVVQITIIIAYFRILPPKIPLFYSHPWGEAQLANLNQLFVFPVFSLIILLLNSYLSAAIFASNVLIARLSVAAAAVVSFFSLYGLIRIIFIVIY